jgi:predicted DNA-binding WGR domain protein
MARPRAVWKQEALFESETSLEKDARAIAAFQCYARFVSIEPEKNRFRFYVMSWQPGLWGDDALIVQWGRIGTEGRELPSFYKGRAAAQPVIDRAVRRRLQRGYRVLEVQ